MCRHYTPKDVSRSIPDVEDVEEEPADDESAEAPEEEPEPTTVADD